jgi:hypothetical protein
VRGLFAKKFFLRVKQLIKNTPYILPGIITFKSYRGARLWISILLRFSQPPELEESEIYLLIDGETNLFSLQISQQIKKSGKYFVHYPDNWDNLSSKIFFLEQPDLLLTWGTQTSNHANKLHNIPKNRIKEIGSSRFPPISELEKLISNNETGKVETTKTTLSVLYIGFGIRVEPVLVVELYSKLLSVFSNRTIEFTYRLHPTQKITESELSRLEEMGINVKNDRSKAKNTWPVSDIYFYEEILVPDLVVLAPSTMVLECALLNKRIILDMRSSDGDEYIDHAHGFKNRQHFKEFLSIDGISTLNDIEELDQSFVKNVKRFMEIDDKNVLSEIVTTSQQRFEFNLISLLAEKDAFA